MRATCQHPNGQMGIPWSVSGFNASILTICFNIFHFRLQFPYLNGLLLELSVLVLELDVLSLQLDALLLHHVCVLLECTNKVPNHDFLTI